MAITSIANSVLQQLVLASTDQCVLQGTSTLILADQGSALALDSAKGLMIVGQPRVLPSCTIPQGYYFDVLNRLTLAGSTRLTMKSTGQLILSDDFASRSRLVLAGANFSPGGN